MLTSPPVSAQQNSPIAQKGFFALYPVAVLSMDARFIGNLSWINFSLIPQSVYFEAKKLKKEFI
jgi:hypothetical protein